MSSHIKKAPGTDAQGPGDLYGDEVAQLVMMVVDAVWPLMIGGLILFVMILKGWERAAIPVGIAVILAQAWLTYG